MENDKQKMIGESTPFLDLLDQVSKAAALDRPVLIVGERGTGKELIASRLHYLSARWDGSFQQLNCAALNENLVESELFGHEAGAFTGANKIHIGRFERAQGGTLFLDELATTSDRIQEKLLRVIEYGEFERLGGNKTFKTNARIVAATNVDLPSLSSQGKFRADLLDRLAFEVLTLPPLRERADDILLLAKKFALSMSLELGREYFAGFSREAEVALMTYTWPGNVRELKNCIERSVYKHLEIDEALSEISTNPFDSPYRLPQDIPAPEQASNTSEPAKALNTHVEQASEIKLPLDLKQKVLSLETELIQKALSQSQHNQKKAAELLSLTYHQFRAHLKKLNI